MRYKKAFAELILIDRGDIITTSKGCFGSSDEKKFDRHDKDKGDRKPFPGRH